MFLMMIVVVVVMLAAAYKLAGCFDLNRTATTFLIFLVMLFMLTAFIRALMFV